MRTFPERSGTAVREVWDGRDDAGDFPGYGPYTWEVTVTSAEGLEASALGTVEVAPPLPEVTRVEFDETQKILGEDGRVLSQTYYEKKNGVVTTNPVLLDPGPVGAVVARGGDLNVAATDTA